MRDDECGCSGSAESGSVSVHSLLADDDKADEHHKHHHRTDYDHNEHDHCADNDDAADD